MTSTITKTLIFLMTAIILMANPWTRQMILFILPLGSGIDDLVFFVLLFLAGFVLLMRVIPVRDKVRKIAKWFSK